MISAENLTKIYPGKRAIAGVSFSVDKGEIVGFLGPNGAGKTTTMRILTCFQPATAGTARIAGYDVFEQADSVKRSIGYLPESPPLYLEMRVREYLEFVARNKWVPKAERRRRLENTLERCGLGDVQHRIVGKLSKGYRQRVGLAQAILHNPPVLILDEPTSGLDPKQVVEVRKLIGDLAGEHTIILSTHILPEVSMTCQRVLIINQGSIVLSQKLRDLDGRADDRETVLLDVQAPPEAAKRLASVEGVRSVEAVPADGARRFRLLCERGPAVRHRLARFVGEQGWQLLQLRNQETSLEEIYLRVVSAEGGPH